LWNFTMKEMRKRRSELCKGTKLRGVVLQLSGQNATPLKVGEVMRRLIGEIEIETEDVVPPSVMDLREVDHGEETEIENVREIGIGTVKGIDQGTGIGTGTGLERETDPEIGLEKGIGRLGIDHMTGLETVIDVLLTRTLTKRGIQTKIGIVETEVERETMGTETEEIGRRIEKKTEIKKKTLTKTRTRTEKATRTKNPTRNWTVMTQIQTVTLTGRGPPTRIRTTPTIVRIPQKMKNLRKSGKGPVHNLRRVMMIRKWRIMIVNA